MRMQIRLRRTVGTAGLIGALGLAGCAGDGSGSKGRAILAALERDGIPSPPSERGALAGAGDGSAGVASEGSLPASGPITLGDLLRVAETRNPDLAVARTWVGFAAGQAWQASLYPNPFVEASADEVPVGEGLRESTMTVGVVQPIVVGGRLRAAADAGEAERMARLAEVQVRVREVFGEIAQLHARLLAIRQADQLYAELSELGGRTLDAARSRFEARAAPETEVIRPQVELYQLDLVRSRLAREKEAAAKQLGLFVGEVEVDPDRLVGTLSLEPAPLSVDALAASLRQSHPALAAADREIDAAEARMERVRAERVPDLEVRVAGGYKGENDDAIVEVGAGVTLPLWDRRQGDLLSARFDLMRVRQERLAVESELLGRLAEAHGEYEAARSQIETVRDRMVPAAQRAYDQTQEAYRAGRAAFVDLLDAQRTLTEARATLVELSGDAAVAKARIVEIVGPDLEGAGQQRTQPGQSVGDGPQTTRPSGAEVKP